MRILLPYLFFVVWIVILRSSRFRCMDEHLIIHTQLLYDSQSFYSRLGWYVLIDYVTRTRKSYFTGSTKRGVIAITIHCTVESNEYSLSLQFSVLKPIHIDRTQMRDVGCTPISMRYIMLLKRVSEIPFRHDENWFSILCEVKSTIGKYETHPLLAYILSWISLHVNQTWKLLQTSISDDHIGWRFFRILVRFNLI